ncbi:GntR family transcriptional regulator [Dactylosporangium sp. NPDC051485]|uniref:GntR family transcriptional regulator n=1 Tax=Dactylosporangium sp. NPDC051485 TaxID=3154846 RepID=UPI00344A89BF
MGELVPRQVGFRDVADALREQLAMERYPPGARLPSEASIARSFGCSRDTVRDAMDVLAMEGWVVRRRGRLAIVRPYQERVLIELPPDATVTVRPMTLPEAESYQCGQGVAMFEVRVGTQCQLYRGDLFALTTRQAKSLSP